MKNKKFIIDISRLDDGDADAGTTNFKEYAGDAELRIRNVKITAPPKSMHLDKFYKKYVDVNGIPIVTSWRVPDRCIVAAHHTLYAMTSMLKPEVLEAMKRWSSCWLLWLDMRARPTSQEHHFMINDTTVNMDVLALRNGRYDGSTCHNLCGREHPCLPNR